ncbi:MAG: hypothetical protein AB2L09_05860 [Coriobacteriia bacterium]
MSRAEAISAFWGASDGLVTGISWVPTEALPVLGAERNPASPPDPAYSLASLVQSFGLDFAFVPAEAEWAAEAVPLLHTRDAAAVWAVSGVFGRAAARLGWMEAIRLSSAEPGSLASVLAEELHAALNDVRRGIDLSVDAVIIADELAGASGFLISPDFALDALIPCYHGLATRIHAAQLAALFHSDGDLRALYPALVHAGYSAVHLAGLTREGIEVALAAVRQHGLSALGGIEVASLATEGVERCARRVARLARAEGLIACDDGGGVTTDDVVFIASTLEAVRNAYKGTDADR